jgi:hypothetical protein
MNLDLHPPVVDWTDFYPDIEKILPLQMLKPLGNPVQMTCFCNANHATNLLTQHLHTSILIFLNNAPIQWYSKQQNAVKARTFGSEFNALHIATELIKALQYKLRLFSIPIAGLCNLFCDNQGVTITPPTLFLF